MILCSRVGTGDAGIGRNVLNLLKQFLPNTDFINLFWLLNTSQFILTNTKWCYLVKRKGQGLNIYCVYKIYMTPLDNL